MGILSLFLSIFKAEIIGLHSELPGLVHQGAMNPAFGGDARVGAGCLWWRGCRGGFFKGRSENC